MIEARLNHRNAYFDTYYIWDKAADNYIGIIEDHCRQVAERYFIGWKFENNKFIPNGNCNKAKTAMFDTYEEALSYIQEATITYDVFCFNRTLTMTFKAPLIHSAEEILKHLDKLYDKWQDAQDVVTEAMPLEEFLVFGISIFCKQEPKWESIDWEE